MPISRWMRFDQFGKMSLFQHACELCGCTLVRVEQIGFDALLAPTIPSTTLILTSLHGMMQRSKTTGILSVEFKCRIISEYVLHEYFRGVPNLMD